MRPTDATFAYDQMKSITGASRNVALLFQYVERWRTVSRKRRRSTSPPTSRATDCDNTRRLRHALPIRDEKEYETSISRWGETANGWFGECTAIPVRILAMGSCLPPWCLPSGQTIECVTCPGAPVAAASGPRVCIRHSICRDKITRRNKRKNEKYVLSGIKRWSSINRWFRLKRTIKRMGSSWRVVF